MLNARRRRQIGFVETDLVAEILGGEIEIRPPLKFNLDGGGAFRCRRGHLFNSVDRADDLFDLFRDRVFDVLGRRSPVRSDDGNRRVFEIGEKVQTQPCE
jgi:hypothetical protein